MMLQGRDRTTTPEMGICSVLVAILIIGAAWTNGSWASEEPVITFENKGNCIKIGIGSNTFANYCYKDRAITRPFFEHLRASDGSQVTRNRPPVVGKDIADHPTFHPGLWMAFGDLSGADSWRNQDRIRHVEFVEKPSGGLGRGSFTVRNRHERKGQVLADEVSRITILVRPSGYLMLWDSEFRPLSDALIFGDQEEMGLGVRMATPLAGIKGGQLQNSNGLKAEAQVWGKTADWCAYTGMAEGHAVGLVLMPHPKNFRPSWFHARDYGLLVANPFGRNAFTQGEKSQVVVKKGDTLRLRFGILIYGGPAERPPELSRAYQDYLQQADTK